MWMLWVQQEMLADLELLVDSNAGLIGGHAKRPKQKIVGKYRLLALWKDGDGVWRVGGRDRNTVPFTEDGKPAISLPEK